MTSPSLQVISEATQRLAAHNQRVNSFADRLTASLDVIIAAISRQDWHTARDASSTLAADGREHGHAAIAARASQLAHNLDGPGDPIQAKKSALRLLGSTAKISDANS